MLDGGAGQVEGIIPAGLWPMPGDPGLPAELGSAGEQSHLYRALAELGAAGIERAVLAASDRTFRPAVLSQALRAIEVQARAEGIAIPDTRFLVVRDAKGLDDLVFAGLDCMSGPMAALVCPLIWCSTPDLMARALSIAADDLAPVVVTLACGWEHSLQSCIPSSILSHLQGVELHRPADRIYRAFAGRAVLPVGLASERGMSCEPYCFDGERLVAALAQSFPQTRTLFRQGRLVDLRFTSQTAEASPAEETQGAGPAPDQERAAPQFPWQGLWPEQEAGPSLLLT